MTCMLKRETDAAAVVMLTEGPRDQFPARGLTIRFQRDAGKKVTALTVDAGRVRDIKFTSAERPTAVHEAQRHEDTKNLLTSCL